jgi:hypothetical protein
MQGHASEPQMSSKIQILYRRLKIAGWHQENETFAISRILDGNGGSPGREMRSRPNLDTSTFFLRIPRDSGQKTCLAEGAK